MAKPIKSTHYSSGGRRETCLADLGFDVDLEKLTVDGIPMAECEPIIRKQLMREAGLPMEIPIEPIDITSPDFDDTQYGFAERAHRRAIRDRYANQPTLAERTKARREQMDHDAIIAKMSARQQVKKGREEQRTAREERVAADRAFRRDTIINIGWVAMGLLVLVVGYYAVAGSMVVSTIDSDAKSGSSLNDAVDSSVLNPPVKSEPPPLLKRIST